MTNETELLQVVQQLADKDVAPFDLQIDRQAKLPNGLFQKIVDLGLLRAKIPKEYGGLDVSAQTAGKIVNILVVLPMATEVGASLTLTTGMLAALACSIIGCRLASVCGDTSSTS